MVDLFHSTCLACCRLVTKNYSTSFTLGVKTLHPRFRDPIYAIYGYVRFADEIVDTFHGYDKKTLLERFRKDTYRALDEGISLNPILHAFQRIVNHYKIERLFIDTFLDSMAMDLNQIHYDTAHYQNYIHGSAEVVGLMCLRIFCEGDDVLFQQLHEPACRLGAAFQKVNFLRDLRSDFIERGRTYFPSIDFSQFKTADKVQIERDIYEDFQAAYNGIVQLPKDARQGVYIAYRYYQALFEKIRNSPPSHIIQERIRVSNNHKALLLLTSLLRFRLNWL